MDSGEQLGICFEGASKIHFWDNFASFSREHGNTDPLGPPSS